METMTAAATDVVALGTRALLLSVALVLSVMEIFDAPAELDN